jgi:hypothetical protein
MYESKKHTIGEIEEVTGVKKATLYRALKNKEFLKLTLRYEGFFI